MSEGSFLLWYILPINISAVGVSILTTGAALCPSVSLTPVAAFMSARLRRSLSFSVSSLSSITASASCWADSLSRIIKPPLSVLHHPLKLLAKSLAMRFFSLLNSSNFTKRVSSVLPRLVVYGTGVIEYPNLFAVFCWFSCEFGDFVVSLPSETVFCWVAVSFSLPLLTVSSVSVVLSEALFFFSSSDTSCLVSTVSCVPSCGSVNGWGTSSFWGSSTFSSVFCWFSCGFGDFVVSLPSEGVGAFMLEGVCVSPCSTSCDASAVSADCLVVVWRLYTSLLFLA